MFAYAKPITFFIMKISIISIGNELLSGDTLNTNAIWIAKELSSIGCIIENQITVNDEENSIISTLHFCLSKNPDYLILTGGLGPTDDDVTRDVLFEFFDSDSQFDLEYWNFLKNKYKHSGIEITESNKNQALKPNNGEVLPNCIGTARGLQFKKNDTTLIAMPGVPAEMKMMFSKNVQPQISRFLENSIFSKTIRTTGIPESSLFDILKDKTSGDSNNIGYYPSLYGVDIRISNNDRKSMDNLTEWMYKKLGDYIYSENKTKIENIVVEKAIEIKKTFAIAESCTGGLIGHRVTNVSKSSDAFKGGVIVYSNKSKIDMLDLNSNILAEYGAVSSESAKQMAENVKNLFGTSYGLSVTGIAGPSGGTKEKPVGIAYVGLAGVNNISVKKFIFGTYREHNKIRTSQAALNMLRKKLFNE